MSARPYVLAHVSDLHVSTFGDTLHDRKNAVRRSARVGDVSASRFVDAWSEAGWRALVPKNGRRSDVVLVDPEGYSHKLPKAARLVDPVERAAGYACRMEARRASTLATSNPSAFALDVLHDATPKNTNVRLLRALQFIGDDADGICATGDLTDDGFGYELLEAAFARYTERDAFFAVPGNHDRYLFPIASSGRPKLTAEEKKRRWELFASRTGHSLAASGAWIREIPEARTVLVGLDSCARPQRRFYRHNGAIGPAQLAFLQDVAARASWRSARHRIVLLHHHVVPLPVGVGRRAPSEIGMSLDDARTVAEAFEQAQVTAVLHGHRHVSEQRHPAGVKFLLLACPSLTLGCKSGAGPSYWRLELGERLHAERVPVADTAVEHESVASLPSADVDDASD